MRSKKGSKFSRIFRLLFENSKIKKVLGTNLAFLVILSSFVPTEGMEFQDEFNQTHVSVPIVLQTQSGIQYPTKFPKITQNYSFYHKGIDIDGKTGEAIYPVMAGKVEAIEYSRFGYGNAVYVNHGNERVSLYAHLSTIEVKPNMEVNKDTKLGEMGSTGRAFGDHLHLEVYESGKAINPLSVLSN